MEDSESSSDEDERKKNPLSTSSFDSSSQSDPNQSPAANPHFAESLDDKELPYEVEARSRASDNTASVATQKREALYTNTVFKPFALSELSWASK